MTGQMMPANPAASVRGASHVVTAGKTPVSAPEEVRALIDRIKITTPVGLRDRALIGIALIVFSFARIGPAVNTHLFRDCVATPIAHDDPEHVRICARILGHSRFSTTEGHYIVVKAVWAADHYHDLIELIRSPPQKRRAQT